MQPSFFERVWLVVRQIPRRQGRQLRADRGDFGHPQAARTVGWALNALSDAQAVEVPWQRVINSAGRISISRSDLSAEIQTRLA